MNDTFSQTIEVNKGGLETSYAPTPSSRESIDDEEKISFEQFYELANVESNRSTGQKTNGDITEDNETNRGF